jgi:hypothetical protein
MDKIVDYLEHAVTFERLAAEEMTPQVKTQFAEQTAAYRRIAASRAKQLGLELPKISN